MLDAKQVQAVFDIIWPQQDWNGGDEGFCRAVAEKVVRALQAVGPEPAVAVKPLEWHKSRMPSWNDGHAMASVFGIEYRITRIWNGSKEQRMWWLVGTVTHDDWYATLESAKAAAQADYASRIRSALVATPPAEQHPDEIAVDCFAAAMKAKLKWERDERNRSGWQDMSAADLSRLLYEHLPKGDPVDVANLSMMLHQNGQQIETPPAEPVVEALRTEADNAYCRFLDKMSAPLCLGVEHKLETGKFGAAELNAHVDARELYGFHRGINHALAALAAKPADKDGGAVVEALPLREIRRRVRNIWGAISSNQIIDKDVEGQAKQLLADIDAALAATEGQNG